MPRVRYVGGLLLAALLELQSCGSELPECFVEFAAYDRAGKSLENWQVTGITRVVRFSDETPDDLLAIDEVEFRPIVAGERIYFHEKWIYFSPWRVKLRDGAGQSVEKEIRYIRASSSVSLSLSTQTSRRAMRRLTGLSERAVSRVAPWIKIGGFALVRYFRSLPELTRTCFRRSTGLSNQQPASSRFAHGSACGTCSSSERATNQ